ncbi:MAG: hypothetical protein O7F76_08185 [Planctomycetota bacterium]|nr:hypothetical protein [Planctomycetota bacterium]
MTRRFTHSDPTALRGRACMVATLSALSLTAAGCLEIEAFLFLPVGGDRIARFFHRASALEDGSVMVTGGLGVQFVPLSLSTLDAVTFFDPRTNSFGFAHAPDGSIARMLTPRSSHTQTTLQDGRVLITGGRTGAAGTHVGTPLNTVEVYDPTTGVFVNGPPMSARRADHTASSLKDGRVVIAGGASWQVFAPAGDAWSEDVQLQHRRSSHAAVVIEDFGGVDGEDRVLLIGGSGTGSNTIELLDPCTMSSIIMSSTLAHGVDDLAAGRLPDGRILIVGGQTSSGDTTNRSYLYDAANDAIVEAPKPPDREGGIADHQLVVLGDFACVFGGEQQASGRDTELDYFAVFDSTIDQWVAHGSMHFAHDDFVAVPITENRVLLVGGGVSFLQNEAPSRNAEVFELTNSINGLLPPN